MISDYSRIYRDSMQQKKLLQCDIFHQRNSAWPLTWLDQVLCLLTTQQRHLLALPQTLKKSLSQLSSLSKDTGTRLLTWCAKTSCSCQCSAWAGSKMSPFSAYIFSSPLISKWRDILMCYGSSGLSMCNKNIKKGIPPLLTLTQTHTACHGFLIVLLRWNSFAVASR